MTGELTRFRVSLLSEEVAVTTESNPLLTPERASARDAPTGWRRVVPPEEIVEKAL
jgi:hypothetical protein